jgi:hypothetical protein
VSRDDDSDERDAIRLPARVITAAALGVDREIQRERERRELEDTRPRRRLDTESESTPRTDEEYRLRAIENRLIAISGEDGTNGRVGNLRADVDAFRGILKWVVAGIASSLIAAGGALWQAGQETGAKKQELEYLRTEVARLRDELRDIRANSPIRPPWRRGDEP